MSDWTDGYVSEVPYTFGYYPELNPNRVAFSLLAAGFYPPRIQRACELGFGQGVSLNIHAAASSTEWWGTDFNPSHASTASSLLRSTGSKLSVFDQSFEEFEARSDLPQFDFIGLHGVWSWISQENREHIVRFIRKNLRVGGVVYASYNTFPGWTSFYPIRHLLTEHRKTFGSSGRGILAGIEGALDFTKKFVEVNSAYLSSNPEVSKRLARVTSQNRRYLAHEYFNEDWNPMFISDIAESFARCKLDFGCPVGGSNLGDLGLSAAQRQMLDSISDHTFQQTVRDFMVNEQFRRDYWVRGPRKLNSDSQRSLLREIEIILVQDPRDGEIDGKVRGGIKFNPDLLYPLIDLLLSKRLCRVSECEEAVGSRNVPFQALITALSILLNQGFIEIAQADRVDSAVLDRTSRFNQHILDQAQGSGDMCFLASPVTGGGVFLSRFKQLYVRSLGKGSKASAKRAWASEVFRKLRSIGQVVVQEGKALEEEEEAIKELMSIAEDFENKDRATLASLGIL